MEVKHTPGPWHVEYRKNVETYGNQFIVLNDERYPSAFVPAWDDPNAGEEYGADEAKANARLIAAAPKMLWALALALPVLEAALDVCASECVGPVEMEFEEALSAIRAAIASAT